MQTVHIRPWDSRDDLGAITRLLHEAYAPLAARGFRYLATHQDDAVTLRRLSSGFSFVAESGDRIIGCISVYAPKADHVAPYYRQPGVYRFGQFAVQPARQKHGIGQRLLTRGEEQARSANARELACDTAEGAEDLIALYRRWGFEPVDHISWSETNYRSVILAKDLGKLAD